MPNFEVTVTYPIWHMATVEIAADSAAAAEMEALCLADNLDYDELTPDCGRDYTAEAVSVEDGDEPEVGDA
jgi:hypothetical protein